VGPPLAISVLEETPAAVCDSIAAAAHLGSRGGDLA
jgi:hypothetical protein